MVAKEGWYGQREQADSGQAGQPTGDSRHLRGEGGCHRARFEVPETRAAYNDDHGRTVDASLHPEWCRGLQDPQLGSGYAYGARRPIAMKPHPIIHGCWG